MQTSTSLRLTAVYARATTISSAVRESTGVCFNDRCVCSDILAVVFFCLKTDLIRAFYAGVLPSFAECKELTQFFCGGNQFTGTQVR